MEDDARVAFNNRILPDWERAMDTFLAAVETRRKKDKLTDEQVIEALTAGYGSEVADAWREWVND